MRAFLLLLGSVWLMAAAGSAAPGEDPDVSAPHTGTSSRRALQAATTCICPAIFLPVCGVNGKTYSNACRAKCAGVKVASKGACPCVCPRIFAPVCGADGKTYSNACAAKCKGVKVASKGACLCICSALFAPVCGADGVTYSNACRAKCKRVRVAYKGPCLGKAGDTCGGIAGKRCKKGLTCSAPAHPDAQGVCKPADGTLGGKCGGFIGIPCAKGLFCKTPPNTADAFGTCKTGAQL